MAFTPRNSFIQAIKGKIIIWFLLGCMALFMAWYISRVAFKEILNTVENISTPNERLRIVNDLSHRISSLDLQQKKQAISNPGNYKKFETASHQINKLLDTLLGLYKDDKPQFQRIRSLKQFLKVRDQQFVDYLKVREGLINNETFNQQLQELVNKQAVKPDSAILTTEHRTATTTIAPEEVKGFLNRIFKRKKPLSYRIVDEKLQIKRDTISPAAEDSVAGVVEGSLRTIEQSQQLKSSRFLHREAILADANNQITQKMLDVLNKVESEAVAQLSQSGFDARQLVKSRIGQLTIILIVFFTLTVVLLYFIFSDITRSNGYRKAIEKAKEEAEYHGMAKQRFLSNMSHEIRTPLQSIIGYAEQLKHQDKRSKEAAALHQSSLHLLQIVNEILDYNRITSGEFNFSNTVFDMQALLSTALDVMQPQARAKGLTLDQEIELPARTYVEGDPFRLKQILFNLLGNAIKFTLSGNITLAASCKQQGDSLHFSISVKDTGIGFSETELHRIFNAFEQVEIPEKHKINQTGTGLGLSIVKAIVEQQGGRIYASSKEGKGSIFTLFLKYKAAENYEEITISETTVAPLNFEGKIWVIDDDPLILDLFPLIFKRHHIEYRLFSSASAVLNTEWDSAVKIILMDMRLPEMSGLELRNLLRDKIPEDVKVYAVTAQVLPDEQALILAQGFNGIVIKPFTEADLLAIFMNNEIVQHTEGAALDLSILKKMTFGDDEQLIKILNRFITDSRLDKEEVLKKIRSNDLVSLRLLMHRMAGRTAQIGAKKIAEEFRKAELLIAEAKLLSDDLKNLVLLTMSGLAALVTHVEEEIYSIS